jgi:APA family basic amino acid/polyamine antiporter
LAGIVLLVHVRSAIGFSSFTVSLYYAITNASAYTLKPGERLFGRKLATLGLISCLVLAFTLPVASVIVGSLVMLLGFAVYAVQRRERRA